MSISFSYSSDGIYFKLLWVVLIVGWFYVSKYLKVLLENQEIIISDKTIIYSRIVKLFPPHRYLRIFPYEKIREIYIGKPTTLVIYPKNMYETYMR